jgi:hypothetical protein
VASVILTGVLSLVSAVVGLLLAVHELRRGDISLRSRWQWTAVVVLLVGAGIVGGVAAFHTLPRESGVQSDATATDSAYSLPPEPTFTDFATVVTDSRPVPHEEPVKPTEPERVPEQVKPRPSIRVTDERGAMQADLVGAIRAALPSAMRGASTVMGALSEKCGADEVFPNITTCRVQLRVTISDLGSGDVVDGFTLVTRGGDAVDANAASAQARDRLIADIRNHFAKKDASR